jgi:uncharacterized protein (DUF1015 family)
VNEDPKPHLVQPFAALRPAPELAAEVAAPPYDVLNTEEARAVAAGKPDSFLHISRPEIDLPPGTGVFAAEVYAKGAENMARLVADGVLRRDSAAAYYIYRLQMDAHVQTGLVAGGSIAAYEANLIRKHEMTRPDKENDRVRQIIAVGAHTGPVCAVHKSDAALAAIIERCANGAPDYSVEAEGGVRHSLWTIGQADDIASVTSAFDRLGVIYIADGHHRSAAARRVAESRRAGKAPDPADPFEQFLIVSFPADEVRILDYNRVLRDLAGMSPARFLDRLGSVFEVRAAAAAKPEQPASFGLYMDGGWHRLTLKSPPGDALEPVEKLDVSILSREILRPLLGISDPRTDPRIDFVGGVRGMAELEARVDGGDWAAAFALYPTRMADLMAVADAGQVMPPKTTWFEPKLADGLISLPLD